MPLGKEDAALVSGIVTQGVFVYGVFAPSVFFVRQKTISPADVEDVGHGVRMASLVTLSVGILTAAVADSPAPFIAAVGTVALMLYVYSRALGTRGEEERNAS